MSLVVAQFCLPKALAHLQSAVQGLWQTEVKTQYFKPFALTFSLQPLLSHIEETMDSGSSGLHRKTACCVILTLNPWMTNILSFSLANYLWGAALITMGTNPFMFLLPWNLLWCLICACFSFCLFDIKYRCILGKCLMQQKCAVLSYHLYVWAADHRPQTMPLMIEVRQNWFTQPFRGPPFWQTRSRMNWLVGWGLMPYYAMDYPLLSTANVKLLSPLLWG